MPGVLLDTSTLRQQHFNVRGAPFETLAELTREGMITLLVPDITRSEIRAGVEALIKEFAVAARAAASKAAFWGRSTLKARR